MERPSQTLKNGTPIYSAEVFSTVNGAQVCINKTDVIPLKRFHSLGGIVALMDDREHSCKGFKKDQFKNGVFPEQP
jgi:hypothetical protein